MDGMGTTSQSTKVRATSGVEDSGASNSHGEEVQLSVQHEITTWSSRA